MRIQTRGNSTTVWLSSSEGVIDGTMSLSAPTLEKILQAVNEKYGTSFEGWSQLPTTYEVGGTIPNWNAYEKILLPEMVNFRFVAGSGSANLTGYMQGDKAYINSKIETSVWNVSPDGQVWGPGGQASLYEEQTKTLLLSNFGRQISEVLPFVVEWQQGSQVPNWESYTLLS